MSVKKLIEMLENSEYKAGYELGIMLEDMLYMIRWFKNNKKSKMITTNYCLSKDLAELIINSTTPGKRPRKIWELSGYWRLKNLYLKELNNKA